MTGGSGCSTSISWPVVPRAPAPPVIRRCALHAADLRSSSTTRSTFGSSISHCTRCAALLLLTTRNNERQQQQLQQQQQQQRQHNSRSGSISGQSSYIGNYATPTYSSRLHQRVGASNRSSSLPAWPVTRTTSTCHYTPASNMWSSSSFYTRANQLANEDFRRPLPGGETTLQQLLHVLHTTKTCYNRQPGFEPRFGHHDIRNRHNIDCDEVYPRIYIGDGQTAINKTYLKGIGITHVVNAAEGRNFGLVNTDSYYYRDALIKYIGFNMLDLPGTDISQFFESAANFIKKAHDSGGRIYVHCMQGVSRSATLVIAYLMIDKGMLAADALRTVKLSRDVHPNEGFLRQLAELDNRLRRQRLRYKLPSS